MNSADIKILFSLQPSEAIAFLKQKSIYVSWDWQDMLDDAHATAFTIAKTAKMDVIDDIFRSINKAIENGQTLNQFIKKLQPILERKGWWGKKYVVNPSTGETQKVQLGSPHRLKTIYLTNLQSAYMAGRYVTMLEAQDTHPYWMYVAIMDDRTRPAHSALHGLVYEASDPVWDTMYPPLDFRCRCRVRPISSERGKKLVLNSPKLETQIIDIGKNEFTGEERFAARTGIRLNGKFIAPSAGFNANVGKSMLSRVASIAIDKAQATHPEIARIAIKEMMKNPKFVKALTAEQQKFVNELCQNY